MVFIQDLGDRKEKERREEKRNKREKKRRKEKANIIILKNKVDILEVGRREGNPKSHFFWISTTDLSRQNTRTRVGIMKA